MGNEKPFKGINVGKGNVDLRHWANRKFPILDIALLLKGGQYQLQLKPVEVYVKEDGAKDGTQSFVFVMSGSEVVPINAFGEITLNMLNDGLKDAGYKIVKL